ncbi:MULTISPECIES: RNA polymerase factor sigma-70 [unclassified Caballeronia]|uniref:RNA polymerase factor sigma-70 n=1 Tax=unclassified Caballeronia TaxID=2646786 RepID=UPI002858146B|nr:MULTISPECIES: RNA polymerase factor sigma-70 [unclassified Caballeronia]MDR5753401.1 RNA polymerase factor sigma-70 [Caballeronia sp. LZ024]MDR5841140.1 RNA polymerase factor sigma-70 [Caballeronia sp. LZ031]
MSQMRAPLAPSKRPAASPRPPLITARREFWGPAPVKASPKAEPSLLEVAIANRQMLVNVARGYVGCASRAEDVVHDVFVQLIDFAEQDSVRQPMGYIARMVRNASIDACRRQSLENTYRADEQAGLDVPSQELTPEAKVQARDTLRRVCDALAQLPARSRTAFEMVRLSEETLQSTARALNVSQTLVHFMVRDAQKHCADCIDACDRNVACPAFLGGRARRR